MKQLFPKQNYEILSLSSYTHISVRDLYISTIGLPIPLHGNMWTDPRSVYKSLTDIQGADDKLGQFLDQDI